MKRTIRLTESDLHRVIKESVKKVLRETTKKQINETWGEHDEDSEEYGDYRYIGRTAAYYDHDDDMYYPDWTWTYSDDINDEDFVSEVYELDSYHSKELDYWLRCLNMNDYQRRHSFNPRTQSKEEMYEYLVKNAKRVK
jgi:hypothetical protein